MIGCIGPAHCAVTACTELQALATLVRRDDETLEQLLKQLDVVIGKAVEEKTFTDEINDPDEGV